MGIRSRVVFFGTKVQVGGWRRCERGVWRRSNIFAGTMVYVLCLATFVGEWKYMGSGLILQKSVGNATLISGVSYEAIV